MYMFVVHVHMYNVHVLYMYMYMYMYNEFVSIVIVLYCDGSLFVILDAPMKAQSQYNPTSVAGRCNAAHVSVGLQDQQSPREMREKIQKQMEHKVM